MLIANRFDHNTLLQDSIVVQVTVLPIFKKIMFIIVERGILLIYSNALFSVQWKTLSVTTSVFRLETMSKLLNINKYYVRSSKRKEVSSTVPLLDCQNRALLHAYSFIPNAQHNMPSAPLFSWASFIVVHTSIWQSYTWPPYLCSEAVLQKGINLKHSPLDTLQFSLFYAEKQ